MIVRLTTPGWTVARSGQSWLWLEAGSEDDGDIISCPHSKAQPASAPVCLVKGSFQQLCNFKFTFTRLNYPVFISFLVL